MNRRPKRVKLILIIFCMHINPFVSECVGSLRDPWLLEWSIWCQLKHETPSKFKLGWKVLEIKTPIYDAMDSVVL